MHGFAPQTKNVSGFDTLNTLSRRRKVLYEEEVQKVSNRKTKCPAYTPYELPLIESFSLGIGECNTCVCVYDVYISHILVCTPFDCIEQKCLMYNNNT